VSVVSPSLAPQHPGHRSRQSKTSSKSPQSARFGTSSQRATAELPGQQRIGGDNSAAGQAEAQGRVVGAAASGSGKKGRERGEVLTNLVEFQFAKKDEPVYAVRTRALDVGQRHVTCETTGYVVCAAAVSAREEAAQGCCRVEERVQGAVRVCSTAFFAVLVLPLGCVLWQFLISFILQYILLFKFSIMLRPCVLYYSMTKRMQLRGCAVQHCFPLMRR
jgi:hypothetical protein